MDIKLVMAVSTGTMGHLTGYQNSGQTDIIQTRWVEFELQYPTDTDIKWQLSWQRFSGSDAYARARAEADAYLDRPAVVNGWEQGTLGYATDDEPQEHVGRQAIALTWWRRKPGVEVVTGVQDLDLVTDRASSSDDFYELMSLRASDPAFHSVLGTCWESYTEPKLVTP